MEKLINEIRRLGIPFDKDVLVKVELYLDKLYEWNTTTSLTSCPREEFLEKHVIFSLNYVDFIRDYDNVFDFGSGNGVPGLILSFIFPEKRFFLIENKKRKIAFLEYISSVLSKNVDVIDSSIEQPENKYLENFCVITKAFKDIRTIKNFFKKSLYLIIPTRNIEYDGVEIVNICEPRVGGFENIKFFVVFVR